MISREEHHLLPFFPLFLGLKMLPFSFQILKLTSSLVKMSMNISAGICSLSPYSPVCWDGSVCDISSQLHLSVFSSVHYFRKNLSNKEIRNPQDADRVVWTKIIVIWRISPGSFRPNFGVGRRWIGSALSRLGRGVILAKFQ